MKDSSSWLKSSMLLKMSFTLPRMMVSQAKINVVAGDIDQGPDEPLQLLHLDVGIVKHHQASRSNPFAQAAFPMEFTTGDIHTREGRVEGRD
jgi:hypothetical protein